MAPTAGLEGAALGLLGGEGGTVCCDALASESTNRCALVNRVEQPPRAESARLSDTSRPIASRRTAMPAALSSAAFVAASLASLAAFAANPVDFLSASLAASCCNALVC